MIFYPKRKIFQKTPLLLVKLSQVFLTFGSFLLLSLQKKPPRLGNMTGRNFVEEQKLTAVLKKISGRVLFDALERWAVPKSPRKPRTLATNVTPFDPAVTAEKKLKNPKIIKQGVLY